MVSMVIALVAGVVALLFAAIMAKRVLAADPGNEAMREIGDAIRIGSSAFLRREYLDLVPFVVIMTIVLGVVIDLITLGSPIPKTAISYLAGTICSAAAGLVGMNVAVRATVLTAAADMNGLNPALRVSFSSGTVMCITVVGIGLI